MTRKPQWTVGMAMFKCGHTVTVESITPAQAVALKREAKESRCPVCQSEAERFPFRLVTLGGKPKGE